MTVNYSAYNDIISIHFIAGCGPSSKSCPTLTGVREKPKSRQAPCLLHRQGPVIIWGRRQFTKMITRISPTCSRSSHGLGLGRWFNQHSLCSQRAYSLWEFIFTPPRTWHKCQWIHRTTLWNQNNYHPPFLINGKAKAKIAKGLWVRSHSQWQSQGEGLDSPLKGPPSANQQPSSAP